MKQTAILFALLPLGVVPASAVRAQSPPAAVERLQIQPPPRSIVFYGAFSRDGKKMAFACYDKTIRIHDADGGREQQVLEGHTERVWTVAFSPDGKNLASCSGDYFRPNDPGEVKVWDLQTGKERYSFPGHKGLVFYVAFAPDGQTLLSTSWDCTIKLWDLQTGKEKQTLEGHQGPVRAVCFTPDNQRFATSSFDGTVRFWDAQTAKHLKTYHAHDQGAQGLAFSPDGRYMATSLRPVQGGVAREIKLWDLVSGKEATQLFGHTNHILSIDFSPNGKMLASGGGWLSQPGEVKLFEVVSGQERLSFAGHKEWVECVRFSPDGRTLVSTGGFTRERPGDVRVWKVADRPKPTRASDDDLQKHWSALAETNAPRAYQSILRLAAAPEDAVPFLRGRLRAVVVEGLESVTRFVGDLNSDSFKVREHATKELERLADLAEPALEAALKKKPSPESRRRIEGLLQNLGYPVRSPELLQALRAIEALELSAHPEARKLLGELAQGVAEARLTREAKAAVGRLDADRPR